MRAAFRRVLMVAVVLAVVAAPHCASARNTTAAMWLSIAHPGLGEWYLKGWGNFGDKCPQNKFWLGFVPIYGWPGYLQVKSAIDAKHGRTNDNLTN